MRNWIYLDTCYFLCLVINNLQIWDIVSFCLLAEILARLSKGRDNFSSVKTLDKHLVDKSSFHYNVAGLSSFSNCSNKRKIFVKHTNTNTYFTVIERRQLLQRVTRKNNKKSVGVWFLSVSWAITVLLYIQRILLCWKSW